MSASPEPRPITSDREGTNETVGQVTTSTSTASSNPPNLHAPQPTYPLYTTQPPFSSFHPSYQAQYMLPAYQPIPSYYPSSVTTANFLSQQVQNEALIAVVMIDMLIRGGNDAQSQYQSLAQQYPRAAAIAQHYAEVAYNQPLPLSSVPNGSQLLFANTEQNFVVDRIKIKSIAWFCCMIATIIATLRIWIVVLLAVFAAIGKNTKNRAMYKLAKELVEASLTDNPRRQLYKSIFNMLNENATIHEMNIDAAAVLMSPFIMGCIGLFVGLIAGVVINMVLRMIGGIRIRTRRPHQD